MPGACYIMEQKKINVILDYIIENTDIYDIMNVFQELGYYDDCIYETDLIDEYTGVAGAYDLLNNLYDLNIEEFYYYTGYGHIKFMDAHDAKEYLNNTLYSIINYELLSGSRSDQQDFFNALEDFCNIERKEISLLLIKLSWGVL